MSHTTFFDLIFINCVSFAGTHAKREDNFIITDIIHRCEREGKRRETNFSKGMILYFSYCTFNYISELVVSSFLGNLVLTSSFTCLDTNTKVLDSLKKLGLFMKSSPLK